MGQFKNLFVYFAVLFVCLSIGSGLGWPQKISSLQASNLLNPNISAIGWFQADAGYRKVREGEEEPAAFQFKEVELSFQSVVDPYARADIFVAIEEGKVDLEEGTLTWFNLPYDLAVKLGKFRANFGRFNRVHTPETAFADRPLSHVKYFGEEGLASAGGSVSYHIPNPWVFLSLDGEVLTLPEAEEVPGLDKAEKGDLLYVGRFAGYYDLNESINATWGGNYVYGSAGRELVGNSSQTLRSQFYGLDLTLRWKNPRRAIYRSLLWQTEIFWNRRDLTVTNSVVSLALFSHLEYQFARRWRAGGRYDWSESPVDNSRHDEGNLIYLTFSPSEFSRISVQGKHVRNADGSKEYLGFLKITFNIGPHGTHAF